MHKYNSATLLAEFTYAIIFVIILNDFYLCLKSVFVVPTFYEITFPDNLTITFPEDSVPD